MRRRVAPLAYYPVVVACAMSAGAHAALVPEHLSEAQNRLTGHFAADVRDYDAVHHHILEMADMLSAGIMHQFPQRFP